MGKTCTTSIDEVVGRDAEVIVDLRAVGEQNLSRLFECNLRNSKTFSTNFENVTLVFVYCLYLNIYVVLLTLSGLTLWNTSRGWGGADLPTLELWLSEHVFIIFF